VEADFCCAGANAAAEAIRVAMITDFIFDGFDLIIYLIIKLDYVLYNLKKEIASFCCRRKTKGLQIYICTREDVEFSRNVEKKSSS
jgi:hypothetical protein